MRRTVQILACLLLSLGWHPVASWGQTLDAANAFITRWQGAVGDTIRVPLYGQYSYEWIRVDRGAVVASGKVRMGEPHLLELAVPAYGEYVLKAGPVGVKRIEFGVLDGEWYESSRGTPRALLRVEQWGRVAWESFAGAFYGCENMGIAEGAGKPDLSRVTSMQSAFERCRSFNSPIGDWDVSNVTNMVGMFLWCHSFNQPLERWDVSKVENMAGMFYECESFNQPLEKWDVSNVTSMVAMFSGCDKFNQPLEKWDVSKVTDMVWMFSLCYSFNQPLEGWNVSKVTDMRLMFSGCDKFNQPLEKWNVSQVTYMVGMFLWCHSFNQPLEGWDVSKVEHMGMMFEGCASFNQPLGAWTLSALRRDGRWSYDLGFSGSGLDAANYSATLAGWAAKRDQLQNGVKVDAEGLKYNAAGKAARQQLIDGKAWVFKDDSEATVVSPVVEIVDAPVWLAVGATYAFTARVVPAEAPQAVTWSVEGDGAAFTDNVLKVTKEGIITVTARSEAVATSKRSVQISVIAPVALTGIAVNPTRARIAIGDTQALALGYTPADATNRAVTWSSSDAGVATVDAQGKVTGVKAGSATITAKSADGGHTATCAVEVTAPVALTSISVTPTSNTLKVNETQQLTVGYTPEDATNKSVTWSSSDAGVATVDAQGKVMGVKGGTATITVTSVDGGHTATCEVTVVADEKPSGVESVALAGVSVSPNPFGDALLVRGAEGVLRYSLVSATGVVVLEGAHDGASELRLETGRLAAGMYWLRLEATDGERVVQVVKR